MIFIDTGVIIAFHNPYDQHHKDAVTILQRYSDHDRFITDFIFDEAVTLTLARGTHTKAVAVGTSILHGDLRMIKVGERLFSKAWNLFHRFEAFSFTDCTTLATLELFHIKKIATFDSEFEKIKGIEVVRS